ncbi:mediator complex subunit 13 C-terminal-domain-containing protein [Aspergillus venezuelensis]
MEFPGGSITNIRVVDGFSNIYWRIYTEETSGSNPPGDGPNNGPTVLKHISRLKELELRLRSQGSLVLSYPRRLGLLIFSATPDFDHLQPVLLDDRGDDTKRLLVGSTVLKVWTSGSVSSADLARSHRSDFQTANANSPAPLQRLQSGPVQPKRLDNSGGSAAIYASFISAVTAAFSVQIVRQNNAIPLGPRTLFNAVENDLDEGLSAASNGPTSVAALTSLHVQLTSVGKLTVALQTIAQTGLTRLGRPGEILPQYPPGTDIWLAPTGSIARLVTTQPAGSKHSLFVSEEIGRWKFNVLEWLGYFGLPPDPITEDGWVELEVWEPFYSKLSGEAARIKEDKSSLPLKRILWPAIYCFKRTKSSQPDVGDDLEDGPLVFGDPLDFAEDWWTKEIPKSMDKSSELSTEDQQPQVSNQATLSPGPTSLSEGVESLSRASLYPEMQMASLVYPTPPDGTTGIGVNPAAVSAEDSDLGSSATHNKVKTKQNNRGSIKNGMDPDVTMEFGPGAGLGVGSGLYDTNEDDDLFGDINEKDFGTKGITDADFSFFDDQDFNPAGNSVSIGDIQESPGFVESSKPDADIQIPGANAPSPNSVPMQEDSTPPKVTEQIPDETQADQPTSDNNALVLSSPHDNSQTISPPLSPVEVKKILFPEASATAQSVTQPAHIPSYYGPVTFKSSISSWDKKYGAEGKFAFMGASSTLPQEPSTSSAGIPVIGLPRRKSTAKMLSYPKVADAHQDKLDEIDSSSSPDSSSEMDDESDHSVLENKLPPTNVATLKRKRARSSPLNSPKPLSEKGIIGTEQELTQPKSEDSVFLGNFLSTFSDWSIAGLFSLPENQISPSLAPRDAQIQIAQLVVDQVTQSSFDHKFDGHLGVSSSDSMVFRLRELLDVSDYLSGVEKLDLNSFVSLQEQQNLFSPDTSGGLTPRQNMQRKETARGSITRLSPPHVRVRRGHGFLETLPPAISFWETFDLEPAHGPKDVIAYCIYPETTTKAAGVFMERLGLLYTSCNLGNHSRRDVTDASNESIGAWDVGSSKQSDYQAAMQQLKTICEELGTALSTVRPSKDSTVVYIINPFLHAASLVDLCAAFSCLLQSYLASIEYKQPDEVLLQIVPMDFVMSTESLVVPPQMDYMSLALEVYSRCSTKQTQPSIVNCAPPVMLAETLPPAIGFKLASDRSSPMQEGKCLHVACSKSQDQRWITVAWSDNTGILQQTMSYCLRFRNSVATRSLSAVRGEIWAATKVIMDRNQARWRVILVSTENVDQDEHETWLTLADQYNKSRPVPVELAILSVNTASELSLSPPSLPMPMSVLNPQAGSTPMATPLPSGSILSPDQAGNAPTPPSGANAPANAPTPTDLLAESDSETLLADMSDESWSVVLSHRLNGILHLTEYRPALASGYLLRRRGTTDTDGAFSMNVNLLFTQRPSSSYEALLREVIGMYRDLATLARVRGTRIAQTGTLPWHIATAVRAQQFLSYVL